MHAICYADISLLKKPIRVKIQRGVLQGKVTSSKLFSAALELAMQSIQLPYGIDIDSERLQCLMFADIIVRIVKNPSELESSLEILSNASCLHGLEIQPEYEAPQKEVGSFMTVKEVF
ncbi:hypothetical protein TELCIR_04122 [Teladorsagia circumcincta]|uniref:Reverse transcriptase domain-containing protein n=1 Tax=Teladorsagia circumcincta TaxID=45464 RepID=A0A2G9UWL3_TELCI|nr:hypothetical protein TELCIR_04122 [Teladorsagia circumcincta]